MHVKELGKLPLLKQDSRFFENDILELQHRGESMMRERNILVQNTDASSPVFGDLTHPCLIDQPHAFPSQPLQDTHRPAAWPRQLT